MNLTGWSAAQVGSVLALAGAWITALYLLRTRRRTIVVPFAALWTQVLQPRPSHRLWRRLRRLLSWLLQVCTLVLLVMALGDPEPSNIDHRPHIVLVDHSLSMAAPCSNEHAPACTRLSQAAAWARDRLQATQGPALVIEVDDVPSVLVPWSTETNRARAIIGRLQASDGEASFTAALALAKLAANAQQTSAPDLTPGPNDPDVRITVISDFALPPADLAAIAACEVCELVRVGEEVGNVALTTFAARRSPDDPDNATLLASVHNLGERSVRATLTIRGNRVPLAREQLELAPGQTRDVLIPGVLTVASVLEGTLAVDAATDDGIARDSHAIAVVPPRLRPRVALVSDAPDLFLEAALLGLGESIDLHAMRSPNARAQLATLAPALIFVDAGTTWTTQPTDPAVPTVYFAPHLAATACPIATGPLLTRPIISEQASEHPLLAHVSLRDVNLAQAAALRREPGDTVLAHFLGDALVVYRPPRAPDQAAVLACGFDLRQTDLPLRTAFPVLIANIVDFFTARAPTTVASVELNAHARIDMRQIGLTAHEGLVTLRAPSGRLLTSVAHDHIIRVPALELGLWTASVGNHGAVATMPFAVQLGSAQASRTATAKPELQTRPVPREASHGHRRVWWWLFAGCCALLLLEWLTFHRRMTV